MGRGGGWAGGRGVRCFQYNIGGLPQNPVRTLATDLPRDPERHTARLTLPTLARSCGVREQQPRE